MFRFLILALILLAPLAHAQTAPEGLMVIYGQSAATREGDVDRREQIFFSVPEGAASRLYVRIFDPETRGSQDFTYGGAADSETTYRIFGGDGAYTAAEVPAMQEDRARPPRTRPDFPITGPGREILSRAWGSDRATDGRWAVLGAVRPRQGEVVDGRVWFRLDIEGTRGNDGNGYLVDVSLARDRSRPPEGLQLFAWQPTIRWTAPGGATRLGFGPNAGGPYTVQSFDAANGDLFIVSDYEDLPVRSSGQDFWAIDVVAAPEGPLALSLAQGFETPNDVTISIFDREGNPVPLSLPPSRAPDPARPTAIGTARPLADCRSVAFDGAGSLGRTPLSYEWDFGDGNSGAENVIAHRYAEPGRYTARLRVLEPGDRPGRGAQLEVPVHVRNAPTAMPGDPIVVAPGTAVSFDASASEPSDSPIARYRWAFGDGTVADGIAAQKAYATPGLYRAILRVEDDSLHPCNFGVATREVTVNYPPVAEAGTGQSAILGQTVTFDGAASYDVDGAVTAWRWDMGDGTVLDGPQVSHAFQASSTYTVALTVTDSSGVANNTAVDTMRVEVNSPPVPQIAIPPRPVSVSEVATLDASASTDADGVILSYLWDFGDGRTGDGQVVNYAWTQPGTFDVTLTVIDNSGTQSAEQKIVQRIVIDAAPVAEAGPDQFVTASVVNFDGTGSTDAEGEITEYIWAFGDGATGTGPTPSHAYARPGIYEVALTVRDDSTAPLNVHRDTMRLVINAAPIADAGPSQVVAPGDPITLSARASVDPDGAIADIMWDTPAGPMEGERVALSLTEPGTYRMGLTVADNFTGGAATDEAETFITVNAQPVAEAGADVLVAPGEPVIFDAGQSYDPDGLITAWLWEFEDGSSSAEPYLTRTFDAPGVYSAQLVVTDNSGVLNATASDSITIRVNHTPVAEAGPEIRGDVLQVTLDASGSSDADGDALIYRWDMGDGSAPLMGQTITHTYPRAGKFPVTLFVDDGTGMANATARDATVVTLAARPVADAGTNREVCSGESILFDASASVDPDGGLLLYEWDFGDGTMSDLVNPTKIYETPGAYPVTLRVQNGSGTEWGSDIARIAALVREGPIADAGPDMTVCTNQPVRFDGSGSTDADGAVNAFSWTFGDGGIASGERPEYRFKTPGNYAVTLTIQGEAIAACSPLDTDTVNVEVLAAPSQDIAGSERAAAGMPATFRAELGDLGGASIVSQSWEFSDGGTATGAEATHTFAEAGEFFITLTTQLAGGNAGCDVIETRRNVIVNAPPMAAMDAPAAVAVGEAVVFDAGNSADDDGALTGFAWDFGDGGMADGVLVAHTFRQPGTYDVTLAVTDDAGVGNSVQRVTQQVVVNPAPAVGLALRGQVCPASPTPWSVNAPAGTTVEWLFDGAPGGSGPEVTHSFAEPGLYPVTALLDDGTGLANAVRREEVYVRVNSAPTALAGPDRIVCPGQEIVFDAGASGDLDGALTDYLWTFSDGVELRGAQATRSFDSAGPVEVTLTVTDDSGSACAIGTDLAQILVNATPQVDAGPDLTVPVGAAHDVVRFDASAASDADGHGLRTAWDFGDGSAASGSIARHRYAVPGTYTVTVQASDPTGLACGIGSDTATITAVARD
ncbi:MAG: PKD domain-containing protein [Pseudomonadota bacterium]